MFAPVLWAEAEQIAKHMESSVALAAQPISSAAIVPATATATHEADPLVEEDIALALSTQGESARAPWLVTPAKLASMRRFLRQARQRRAVALASACVAVAVLLLFSVNSGWRPPTAQSTLSSNSVNTSSAELAPRAGFPEANAPVAPN